MEETQTVRDPALMIVDPFQMERVVGPYRGMGVLSQAGLRSGIGASAGRYQWRSPI